MKQMGMVEIYYKFSIETMFISKSTEITMKH
jgi:hypothetical protein